MTREPINFIRKLSVLVFLCLLVAAALLFIPVDLLIPKTNRELSWARTSTEAKIRKFEVFGYAYELRRWIEEPQDGAISMEVAFTLLDWAERNPTQFNKIFVGIDEDKRLAAIDLLCQVVGKPSDQTKDFVESRKEATFLEIRKCLWK